MVYSVIFVTTSVASQLVLGECFLTTLARDFADAATSSPVHERRSFTVRLVEAVAGMRPNERAAVLIWQVAILVTSIGMLFYLRRRDGKRREPPVTAPRTPCWR
jgi:hypothetical protein